MAFSRSENKGVTSTEVSNRPVAHRTAESSDARDEEEGRALTRGQPSLRNPKGDLHSLLEGHPPDTPTANPVLWAW